jgi:hypothetical protein
VFGIKQIDRRRRLLAFDACEEISPWVERSDTRGDHRCWQTRKNGDKTDYDVTRIAVVETFISREEPGMAPSEAETE